MINLNVLGKKVNCFKDSRSELTIFYDNLIPEKYKTGQQIELILAIGSVAKADLVKITVSLWNDRKANPSKIYITAAIVDTLNCNALITPSVCRRLANLMKEDKSAAKLE